MFDFCPSHGVLVGVTSVHLVPMFLAKSSTDAVWYETVDFVTLVLNWDKLSGPIYGSFDYFGI